MKNLSTLLILLAACAAEPVAEAPGSLVDVDMDPAPWCAPPPYSVLHGPGFRSWASPLCKGDVALKGTARGWIDPTQRRCAQWVTGAETEAEVLCADRASPVEMVYYRDWNYGGVCKPWTLSGGPWFIWRSCGVQPVPQEDGTQL